MHERIQIVDAENKPLRGGTKEQAWKEGSFHQIVRVVLKNKKGDILLQRRSETMEIFPLRWTDSASGHVDLGESAANAASRELREELGVETPLHEVGTFLTMFRIKDKTVNTFNVVYTGLLDSEEGITADPKEVRDIRWVNLGELKTLLLEDSKNFTPYLSEIIHRYF